MVKGKIKKSSVKKPVEKLKKSFELINPLEQRDQAKFMHKNILIYNNCFNLLRAIKKIT